MDFDYISDIHLDFWVKLEHNPQKMNKKIKEFTGMIIPSKPSKTLLIAGDIGHYNQQNVSLIYHLREVYKTIFYVFGNHDYYLLSNQMRKKYKNSYNKTFLLEEELKNISGVYRLNGNAVEVEGVRYGGSDMWYDLSYGVNHLNQNKETVYQRWWEKFNDRNFHFGLPSPVEHFQMEKEKIADMECDVFISHVPPIGIPIADKYVEKEDLSYYTFDSEGIFKDRKPKVWLSGHMHQSFETDINGIHMIANALGYPESKKDVPGKIRSFRAK